MIMHSFKNISNKKLQTKIHFYKKESKESKEDNSPIKKIIGFNISNSKVENKNEI